MKKSISLLLVVLFAFAALAGCSAEKATVSVKVVIDRGYDGIFDETLYEGDVEISGKNISVDAIINQLSTDGKITTEYTENANGDTVIKAINGNENKNEGVDPVVFYEWISAKNNSEVKGLWSDTLVADSWMCRNLLLSQRGAPFR
ncbi:MAG: hypothetical protein CVU97_00270 [Firmicutes bacterium HGW-Firmicutes-21]|nr:MAG: hypothetical protein CVU97_00270 [Firmicutes bacterium HGW-Firmicutes-21]